MNPHTLCLYCCTHLDDIHRVVRLAKSIAKYNSENIPLYISAPEKEISIFKAKVDEVLKGVIYLPETSIIAAIPNVSEKQIYGIRGGLRQQIIKSNFWQLGLTQNYLCLDSDCIFLRPFFKRDFLVVDDIPYSVIHEGKTILQPTQILSKRKHRDYFINDRNPIQKELKRPGVTYDFGYAPFIWSSKVWKSLEVNYLKPNKKSFLDIIVEHGSEFTWYGEALLTYKAIEIFPREELFKHYHYQDQYLLEKIIGINDNIIQKDYLGKVIQSSWEKSMTHKSARRPLPSILTLWLKTRLKSITLKIKILKNMITT